MSGYVTTTGVEEMRRAIDQLPQAVTSALHDVALRTARSVMADAKQRLAGQLKTAATSLINNIHVVQRGDGKGFEVISSPPAGQDANVPIYNEYGTVKMGARPYMRPALDAAQDAYRREMEVASAKAATEVFR